jgi:hypothetical protein
MGYPAQYGPEVAKDTEQVKMPPLRLRIEELEVRVANEEKARRALASFLRVLAQEVGCSLPTGEDW